MTVLRVVTLILLLLAGFGADLPALGSPSANDGKGPQTPAFFAGGDDTFGHGPFGPLRIEPPERQLPWIQLFDSRTVHGPDFRAFALEVDRSLGADPGSPSIFLSCCSFLC